MEDFDVDCYVVLTRHIVTGKVITIPGILARDEEEAMRKVEARDEDGTYRVVRAWLEEY